MPTRKPSRAARAAKSTPVKRAAARRKAPPAAARAAAPVVPAPQESRAMNQDVNQETIETVLKAGTQAASKSYEQVLAIAQEQVERASQSLFTHYDEAAGFGLDNVDACVLSGTALSRGVEAMSREVMALVQSAVEVNVATTKALLGATSVRELVDLQAALSRRSLETVMAESARLTDLGFAVASDTVEPIQARVNATVDRLMKPVAV